MPEVLRIRIRIKKQQDPNENNIQVNGYIIYQSAKDVLFMLNDRIIPGTVILFDEFPRGEDRAFKEWLDNFDRIAVLIKKSVHLQAAYSVIK